MKKITLILLALVFGLKNSEAQLYSSGNNIIAGNSVGIGTSTPSLSSKLHIVGSGSSELLRLQNNSSSGLSKFIFYNDNTANYATFTKYGSTYSGGYSGAETLFPYANLFAFGNNNGGFLNVTSGNVGLAVYKSGLTKLKFFIDYSNENVGIGGNNAPRTNIHFNNALSGDTLKITNVTTGHTISDGLEIRTTGNAASIINRENSTLDFGTNNSSKMSIASDGKVSIGTVTTPTGYKLYVESGILTEKVKVALKSSANWADYVFADNYDLKSLAEVEKYINEYNHLPGVPSAQEVVDNGLDLATMDAKLLEKIEELTLYMIQLKKEVEELKNENALLKSK